VYLLMTNGLTALEMIWVIMMRIALCVLTHSVTSTRCVYNANPDGTFRVPVVNKAMNVPKICQS